MEFYEVVRKRRSIRKYGPQPVEAATLDRILDAGTRGPTGAIRKANPMSSSQILR